MSFDLDIGLCLQRGPRHQLEDHAGVRLPTSSQEEAWGAIAAVADGVSTGGGGREAAVATVAGLLRDYHATPPTWDTTVALDRLIAALNSWLADHNRRRQNTHGEEGEAQVGLTTLTALVLRGHSYTLAHVGDTRAHLLREGECLQLSQDHSMVRGGFQGGLTRALGLDDRVTVDYLSGDVQIGDTFVLSSDGVHGVLSPAVFGQLAADGDAQSAADALVARALASGGRDNATALVVRVRGLASTRLEDWTRRGAQLPVPHALQPGDVLDGLRVEACVHANGVHRLYQVRELSGGPSGGLLRAMKVLHEARANDPQERAMLAHEAWLGARVTENGAEGLVRVHEPHEPTCFYVLFDWHPGQSLAQMLAARRAFTVREVMDAASILVRALGRLHRHGVIHRDIKPENLHLGEDGQWRLMDLGVALSGNAPEALRVLHAGTPSYMNPEQWSDDSTEARVSAQSDLFAMGVTLYRWLTGRLPYGDVEPYQIARYRRDPVPPSRLRPDVPIWLDHVVLKAIARDPRQRFETAEELLLALERGASRPLHAPLATPLMARNPQALWQLALGVSLLFNVLLLYWLLFLPRH